MNIDKICNLQCVKAGDVHEFVGPVKILMVDPPKDEYRNRKIKAAFLTFASMLIGANTFYMLLFCFGFKLPRYMNGHILLCTLGYQFCMPFGILMLNSLFGPAVLMEPSQRRTQHISLQCLGMTLYGIGSAMAILKGEKTSLDSSKPFTSYHCYSGCAAACLAGMCFLTGPWLFCIKSENITSACFTSVHRVFGIFAFISSSACLLFGISKPIMYLWFYILGYHMAPAHVARFVCVAATLFVIYNPFMNIIEKFKRKSK